MWAKWLCKQISLGCNFNFHLVVKRCYCYGWGEHHLLTSHSSFDYHKKQPEISNKTQLSWGLIKISAGGNIKNAAISHQNKKSGDPQQVTVAVFSPVTPPPPPDMKVRSSTWYYRNMPVTRTNVDPSVVSRNITWQICILLFLYSNTFSYWFHELSI